jgi:hypothetical protein
MEFVIRNNFDARPYVHVPLDEFPSGDWDWRNYGPIRVGFHETGLVKYTPWELAAHEVNIWLPDRLHIIECILNEGRVGAVKVQCVEKIAKLGREGIYYFIKTY